MPDIVLHGASSFLGRNLVRKFIANKIPATILARESSDLSFIGESEHINILKYKKSLNEISANSIHLKKPVFLEFSWHGVFGSDRNVPEQISINIPLTISSVEFAHTINTSHWIGIGSQAEYGNLDKRIHESDPTVPTTLYGKSKLMCSQISSELCKSYSIEHSWLRLFSVYGPDDNHEWLIQYLIREMLLNHEVNVTKGEQAWDYLYIDDIAEMLLKLIDSSGVGIANLGSGRAIPVKIIVNMIKELTHSESKINFGAIPYRPDQVMLMEADNKKLTSHLNWQATTSMEEGLKNTINFLKAQD